MFSSTYRSWNEETREQVPEAEEETHANSSDLDTRSECHHQHTIQCEDHEGHVDEKEEPEYFIYLPPKIHHGEK